MKRKAKKSDHFDGKRFYNLDGKKSHKGLVAVLKWKATSKVRPWPKHISENSHKADLTPLENANDFRVTFVNHASLLIQWRDLNILTDPVLLKGVGPFHLGSLKRYQEPGIKIEDLPRIDFILISHNHYDHLDRPSLIKIFKKHSPQVLVPLGVKKYIPKKIKPHCTELDWWEHLEKSEHKLKFSFVPAHHWSKRTFLDTNRSLWGGFIIEKANSAVNSTANSTVFFAGDTAYSEHFKKISQRFPNIDLALLPIGAYEPRYFMKEAHMNPAEAVQAAIDLQAKSCMGIHFGTFPLADEGLLAPLRDLEKAMNEKNFTREFFAPKNGQSLLFSEVDF